MSQNQNDTHHKDGWDKADILIKGLGVAVISGAIAVYGTLSNSSREREAELNRKAQLFVQTMSNRESSESTLRAKMFEQLMTHYFDKKDEEAQLLFLKLIAINFQEYINLKPLFEHMDRRLTSKPQKMEVRKIAKEIINRQISELEGSGGELLAADWIQKDKPAPLGPLELTLLEVEEDRVRIKALPEDEVGFEVTYFDMPYVDSSTINAMRYSVILVGTNPAEKKARVKVVFFPENYVSPRDRPRMDLLVTNLLGNEEISVHKNNR